MKALNTAFDDGFRAEGEMARAAGVTVQKAREVLAANAAGAVLSLDGNAFGEHGDSPAMLADHAVDVEGQAVVSSVLESFLRCFDGLDPETQMVLVFRYHLEYEVEKIAELLFITEQRVTELHDGAVLSVHRALLLSVQAEGTGPRRPAQQVEIAVHVRSADSCSAAEGAAVTAVKRCPDCRELLPVSSFSWRDRQKGYRVPYCPPSSSVRAGAAYVKRKAARGVTIS